MAASVESPRHPAHPLPPRAENQGQYDIKTIALIAVGAIAVTVMVAIIAVELFHLIRDLASDYFDKSTIEDLKKRAKAHLPEKLAHLVDIADDMGASSPKSLLKRLEMTHEDEKKFLLYIIENFDVNENDLKEILKGAHVRLDDGGESYTKWEAELNRKNERISSHPSDGKQYGMQGALIKELLFSKIEDNTWFQLENHPTSLGHVIRHGIDYVRYKIYSANQGPWGESYFKDSNPLVLGKRKRV